MGDNGVGLGDLAAAVVRIADTLDRAVFVLEAWSVAIGVVQPEDVGMVMEKPDET